MLFPEGTWFRQNDRLGPLQEGVSLMARQACKQAERPILIHPVAIKYWALEDPRPVAAGSGWTGWKRVWVGGRSRTWIFLPRLEKLANAFLAVKEIEVLGQANSRLGR